MTQPLNLLVVTMTGTAEMIAEDLAASLAGRFDVNLQLAENADVSIFRSDAPLIVISSTYGQGEIPDPGKPLFRELCAIQGDLKPLRYGVISLGDSVYAATFANGGQLWDRILRDHGATPVRDALLLDASGTDDMAASALSWLDGWVAGHEAQGRASEACA